MYTIAELAPTLTDAETRLIDACSQSERVTFGDGTLPENNAPDRTIRADVVRALLLDPDAPPMPKGLRLRGAWITGSLDLQGAEIPIDVSLSQCHLTDPVSLVNAILRGLYVSGCIIPGLSADHAHFDGPLYLRGGSVIHGEISLAGATVQGDVQLCDLTIQADGQDSIFAPQLMIEGSLFLGNYPYADGTTSLMTEGMLFFSSLRAGHDVFVSNCAIAPNQDPLFGGVFGGTEEHGPDIALSLARAQVGGLLYFQDNQINQGSVNLAGASVARLTDEPEGPGARYPIRLDGFRYNDFSRHTDTSVVARLKWLERRPPDTPFTAQPYEQLASVLGAMGHRVDAEAVLMRKERMLRQEARREMTGPRWLVAHGMDAILRAAVGYGYRPARAIVVSIVLILALGLFFHKTWRAGDMTPNAAPILVSQAWVNATVEYPENPAGFWSQPGQAGQDWETFNAYAYAADLLIPIVDLGQESAWAPSTSRSPLGRVGWWLRWFAKGVGWIVTALFAAAITGMIRRD